MCKFFQNILFISPELSRSFEVLSKITSFISSLNETNCFESMRKIRLNFFLLSEFLPCELRSLIPRSTRSRHARRYVTPSQRTFHSTPSLSWRRSSESWLYIAALSPFFFHSGLRPLLFFIPFFLDEQCTPLPPRRAAPIVTPLICLARYSALDFLLSKLPAWTLFFWHLVYLERFWKRMLWSASVIKILLLHISAKRYAVFIAAKFFLHR